MPTKRSVSQMRYDRKSTKNYGLKLNQKTDADIISYFEKVPIIQGYIKSLIRADIANNESSPDCSSSKV